MYQQYLWVFDQNEQKIVYKEVRYVPGLYKIFGMCIVSLSFFLDEILVNAADNY